MRKLKILFVTDQIFPDKLGGVGSYIHNVAKGLVNKGHAVFILTQKRKEESPAKEVIDGIQITRYQYRHYPFAFLQQLSWISNIRREVIKLNKRHSFDSINLHSPHAALGVDLSNVASTQQLLYTFHAPLREEELIAYRDTGYSWGKSQKYIKWLWFPIYLFLLYSLEKRALKKCKKIVTLSSFSYDYLIKKHGISTDKVVKIPGGVDIEQFKPPVDKNSVRKELKLPLDRTILFTVRRLVPRMGLDNLIKAMPAILEKHQDTILLIGGNGPLASTLQNLIGTLKLNNHVFLLYAIDNQKLPLYYQASDLFILPSKELEGFGLVTLEALACGVPVLGTPVGGTIEILSRLDKKLMFKDTTAESMAELIIEYLRDVNKKSETERKCREFILDNYSWEYLIQPIEMILSEMALPEGKK
jgi:glycosyltransferase involved in cell wall biosynthesis